MSVDEPDGLKRVTLDITVRVVGCPSCGGVAPLTVRMDVSDPSGFVVRCQLCGERIEWGHIVDATSDITAINGRTDTT